MRHSRSSNHSTLVAWCIALFSTLVFTLARASIAAELAPAAVDEPEISESQETATGDDTFQRARFVQPQSSLTPSIDVAPQVRSPLGAQSVSTSLFGDGTIAASFLGQPTTPQGGVTGTAEANVRSSTDVGNLLGKSPFVLSIGAQRRNPIVTDPRIRGSRVGQLAASGSHWVPARIDLDTAVNKINSHAVDRVAAINGPYTTRLGPGFQFLDIQLQRAPRYADGPETHASLGIDYKHNGNQVYGREAAWGGNDRWGWKANLGQSGGGSYSSGNGSRIPAGFNSRDYNVALGYDLTDDSFVEFNYLGLGQNNLLLPGQVFDIDKLGTDAFEVTYGLRDQYLYDLLTFEVWTNDTTFDGSAQRNSKREFFPFLDDVQYVGFTHVNSASTGYNLATSWQESDGSELVIGTDMRLINQFLNEIGSGNTGGLNGLFVNANSPIPQSYTLDFGIYAESALQVSDVTRVSGGVRGDFARANITADPATLQRLGNYTVQPSFAQIVGSTDTVRNFSTAAGFLTAEYSVSDEWTWFSKVGASQRTPNQTELYAAQPFMALLQNGLNTVTGDPTLRPESLLQTDIGMTWSGERLQAGVGGFYAWGFNYITFENIGIVYGPGLVPEQVALKYVNTDLATFFGTDAYLQYDYTEYLTPFGTLTYVEGTDQTRNGNFATQPVGFNLAGVPVASQQVAGATRGAFNNGALGGIPVGGPNTEPLPSILPLQARLGVRWHARKEIGETTRKLPWSVEFSTRLVASQTRVASSLLETTTRGFTLVDINTYWQSNPNTLFKLGFENIGGINYREHLDYRSQDPRARTMVQPCFTMGAGAERTC